MSHQIDRQSRDLAAWEAWARWPDIVRAARLGAGVGATIGVLALLAADVRRIFVETLTHPQPLRVMLFGILLIALNALAWGLLSAGIAVGIRLVRRAYLSVKRRELADRSHSER